MEGALAPWMCEQRSARLLPPLHEHATKTGKLATTTVYMANPSDSDNVYKENSQDWC